MTNSPKLECSDHTIWDTYTDNDCESKMVDCFIDIIDRHSFNETETDRHGAVEYRFEERTSRDGSCIIQTDVYALADGTEKHFIVNLEVNGEVRFARYDKPRLFC